MSEIEGYPCPHCGFDANTQPQPGYALPQNTILHGKYLVGRMLGQGGFGITYVGYDLTLEVKVSIKEFYPSGQVNRQSTLGCNLVWNSTQQSEASRNAGMDSFLKEARKMARVDRILQVVRVRETFRENDTAYIIMDFVEGETLKARLEREGPMPFARAMEIFRPAIAAMEEVHKAGLIHRDLSPDNLMLEPGGGVRILDLGAAKDLAVNQGASSMLVTKGGFSPMEQYGQRGGSGPWTDVYAMAATIYYALTGRVPPNAIDRLDDDELRWDFPALQSLSAPAREALQKAMAVQAKNRTQSMEELLAGLERPGSKPGPEPKPDPNPKPNKKLWIIPVCVCAAVLIFAVWMISARPTEPVTPAPPSGEPAEEVSAHLSGEASEEAPVRTPLEPSASPSESTPVEPPAAMVASGKAGPSVTWTLDDAGALIISGSGEMENYDEEDKAPWYYLRNSITRLSVEFGVAKVGTYAFCDCTSLESLTLSEGLSEIGRYAFGGCTSLSRITIPDSVTKIGHSAFSGCTGLESVTLPEGVDEIGAYAFDGCTGLERITLPEGVTEIGQGAFNDCSGLKSVTFPEGLAKIGNYAFDECVSLERITLPEGVDELGEYAFYGCISLSSITIPGSVALIGRNAISCCDSLESITLPEGVAQIGHSAFYDCANLKSIELPETMTQIDIYAFLCCDGLTDVYYSGTEAQWNSIAIEGGNTNLTNANIHYNS